MPDKGLGIVTESGVIILKTKKTGRIVRSFYTFKTT
jgi:hypothetical protein